MPHTKAYDPRTKGDANPIPIAEMRTTTGCISYYDNEVEVHRSALKHGIQAPDAYQAAGRYLAEVELDDDPRRVLRLGFDTTGRLLETVVLQTSEGRELVIHAMRARQHYIDELL